MNLKKIGLIVISVGVVGLLIGLNLDTSVETGHRSSRVHNIGLMQQQQNFLLISALLAVIGVILFAIGKTTSSETIVSGEVALKRAHPKEQICPFCAETIKAQAILCRYCGKSMESRPMSSEPLATESVDTPIQPKANTEAKFATSITFRESNKNDKGIDLDEAWVKFKRFWM